jgi:16S rRNA processing protein RimM
MGYIPVGRVVSAHGLKGEVKLRYYNETTDSLRYPSFFVDRSAGKIELKPARVRRQGKLFLIKFKQLDTIEAVDFLIGKELFVLESDLPALGEDEFYDYQLIGLEVTTESGELIGRVENVMHIRERDVLVVQGKVEILVPMTADHIVKIDTGKGIQVREEALAE